MEASPGNYIELNVAFLPQFGYISELEAKANVYQLIKMS